MVGVCQRGKGMTDVQVLQGGWVRGCIHHCSCQQGRRYDHHVLLYNLRQLWLGLAQSNVFFVLTSYLSVDDRSPAYQRTSM